MRVHLLERPVLGFELRRRFLSRPLEGRVGLGHVVGGGDADAGAVADDLASDLLDLRGPVDDAFDVGHGLGRQADHEVELDRGPALLEGVAGGVEQVLFVDDLADGIAQPLRAGLGGEGHRVLLARRAEQGDIDAEAVDAG